MHTCMHPVPSRRAGSRRRYGAAITALLRIRNSALKVASGLFAHTHAQSRGGGPRPRPVPPPPQRGGHAALGAAAMLHADMDACWRLRPPRSHRVAACRLCALSNHVSKQLLRARGSRCDVWLVPLCCRGMVHPNMHAGNALLAFAASTQHRHASGPPPPPLAGSSHALEPCHANDAWSAHSWDHGSLTPLLRVVHM